MPITVSQRWEGAKVQVSSDNATISSEYIIEGTDDEFAAEAALGSATSLIAGGLIKKEVSITDRLSEFAWAGEVSWGKFEPKETGDSSFSFDTGGGTQHITQSLATVASYAPPGKTAPNFKGAVGVSDGSVDGVDITVPIYNFNETHYLDVAIVDAAYKLTLFDLTGTVNSLSFKGFAAGEVLFQGASGSLRQHDQWEISYKFAASPNATGLSVGDITGIDKGGWDYLWVRYREEDDASAKTLARRPVAAYVERVYPLKDLNLLGI
jgi:hypothetical protein